MRSSSSGLPCARGPRGHAYASVAPCSSQNPSALLVLSSRPSQAAVLRRSVVSAQAAQCSCLAPRLFATSRTRCLTLRSRGRPPASQLGREALAGYPPPRGQAGLPAPAPQLKREASSPYAHVETLLRRPGRIGVSRCSPRCSCWLALGLAAWGVFAHAWRSATGTRCSALRRQGFRLVRNHRGLCRAFRWHGSG